MLQTYEFGRGLELLDLSYNKVGCFLWLDLRRWQHNTTFDLLIFWRWQQYYFWLLQIGRIKGSFFNTLLKLNRLNLTSNGISKFQARDLSRNQLLGLNTFYAPPVEKNHPFMHRSTLPSNCRSGVPLCSSILFCILPSSLNGRRG